MRLLDIINRLADPVVCPLLNGRAKPAYSVNDVDDNTPDIPVAFVHPWREVAADNQLDGDEIYQHVANAFAVQIVAANITGAEEPLEDVRDEIRAALLGWQGNYAEPIEYRQGEVLDVTRKVIRWRDIYSVGSYYRSN